MVVITLVLLCVYTVQAHAIESLKKPFYFNKSFNRHMLSTHMERKTLQKAELLFNTLIVKRFSISKEPRIPKKIHQTWFSGPVPAGYHAWQRSWQEHHPQWEYKLWTLDDVRALDLRARDVFEHATSIATKADIARYEILYHEGGLYVDMDMECLKPFDIFHHCCDLYAPLLGQESEICLLGSKPKHPLLNMILESIKKSNPKCINFFKILKNTGPYLFRKNFNRLPDIYNSGIVLFPQNFFLPFPVRKRFAEATSSHPLVKKWIKPESYALHYWHGSWIKNDTMLKGKPAFMQEPTDTAMLCPDMVCADDQQDQQEEA